MANRPSCSTCMYKSGEGSIIICLNKIHFGMAMNAYQICDYFERAEPTKPPIIRLISDTIAGEDR